MEKIENLKVCIQCMGVNGKIGTFLKGVETGKQYTKTFTNCNELFGSIRYVNLRKKHKIN